MSIEKLLSRMKLFYKVFFLGIVLTVCFVAVLGWLYVRFRTSAYEARQAQTKNLVEAAGSIIDHYAEQAKAGKMSEAEAQDAAAGAIRVLRYGDNEYFWINDTQPQMVMHPISPELEGQELSDYQDPTGKKIFIEFVNVAETSGAGFVDYQWPKPGSATPVPKISYVKWFPQWGWVMGTGVYVDDVEADIANLMYTILGIAVGTILVGIGLSYVLARSISRPVSTLREAAYAIARGDINQNVGYQANDEIGELAEAFRHMIGYQQQMAGAATRLAQGDVSLTITPQSDKDVLGNAFDHMIGYQQQMAEVADQLAQGDLTATITPQSDKDVLGSAFQQMILNLRNLIGQMTEIANTVGDASAQLSTAADQAGQATQQVAATIQQVAQGTTQQTQAVTEAVNNVQQMTQASEGIARGAQEQALGVTKTSELTANMTDIVAQVGQTARSVSEANAKVTQAARLGVSTVGQTSQGIDAIRSRTLAAADKVKEMGHRSKEIGRIVETIDNIADKTDMLALNAAVEAARAGEYGRGFAVVADQVRKLSEDSKLATRDIGQLIERVQETVREAIAAMESTVAEVDTGTRLTGDTTHSLEEILLAAENADSLAGQIAIAINQLKQRSEGVASAVETVSAVVEENSAVAEQLAANSQEVMGAMEGVASVAEENSAAAEQVSAAAEEMSAQVEEVVASAQELSGLAEQLRQTVTQFQVEENGSGRRQMPPNKIPSSGRTGRPLMPMTVRHSNGQK